MGAYIYLYVLRIKSMFYPPDFIKDTLKGRVKSMKVNYSLGCHDTPTFRRMLISNHPICDSYLF